MQYKPKVSTAAGLYNFNIILQTQNVLQFLENTICELNCIGYYRQMSPKYFQTVRHYGPKSPKYFQTVRQTVRAFQMPKQ